MKDPSERGNVSNDSALLNKIAILEIFYKFI